MIQTLKSHKFPSSDLQLKFNKGCQTMLHNLYGIHKQKHLHKVLGFKGTGTKS